MNTNLVDFGILVDENSLKTYESMIIKFLDYVSLCTYFVDLLPNQNHIAIGWFRVVSRMFLESRDQYYLSCQIFQSPSPDENKRNEFRLIGRVTIEPYLIIFIHPVERVDCLLVCGYFKYVVKSIHIT